ncbi:hypothetical protein [Granulicella sp. S190]|uniref:hypothetical protein n=1 Tax=Granulicella sp. S190 TaxID=1747226 RepID=UPI00131AB4E7|nr:hypothetical protein [Granulicella sp. S190]
MQFRVPSGAWCGLSFVLISIVIAGCHSAHRGSEGNLLLGLTKVAPSNTDSNRLAEDGSAAITAECGRQSFEDARKALIISETELEEDVFTMKGRSASSAPIGFGLDDALRLEELLQKRLQGVAQTDKPTQCVQKFEIYLETLTDPMVERDRLTKQQDNSAYNDATKQAQDEVKKEKEIEALAPKN